MIAMVNVDPSDPKRLFVAALGHPYGPNSERGVFRSTDGGQTFEKVLYKDEYTSANDVRINPRDPRIVYAGLWQQQQAFYEGGAFGASGNGVYRSTDGGTTWTHLTNGLPDIIEANLAIAPGNADVVYTMVAHSAPSDSARGGPNGVVGLYRSDDRGEHWHAVNDPSDTVATRQHIADPRPLVRIGGGDLPTLAVDPMHDNVVYSSSTVMWRSDNGGVTWSAVRGSPGGDDYQRTWINPANPNILLIVSDQGGVVSANQGVSWSNWYTQPTAAMYHVTTDNAFPYRVCGGQQDSGSGCVESRSMDGEITFHDWHPVDIQEYGIAAPDPRNPDLVYGSMRTNISLYNRTTGQTTFVGPDMTNFGRNVRTMPLAWSPVDHDVLFYASDAVWKSVDHAHSWTRISPDLARQTWDVPASAGKYESTVKPSPRGAITALALSPRNAGAIWAGTDNGFIQVTADGGIKWTNVTPPPIKPWTRIFNIDAGHFDSGTAYAAANTLRIDDLNPHFWRTHDGGKTWAEIDNGIAAGAVANSIREDPRKKGLLYAATDAQVWVSFDDGDHWQSLRLNMPAISVRDLEVSDDSSCLCADLVAGTHGRGFWILDDITPLRQTAAAQAASAAYLFKPAVAVRIRFGTNDPTPWPPELPAGQNPPPGAIIDYYLAADGQGAVALDILDSAGKAVRSYSSADPHRELDPAVDPVGYNQLCQENPTAPDCALPLYWPGPEMMISTRAGMHRVAWDLHYAPVMPPDSAPHGEEAERGAVPHRTYPPVYAPWAPPGRYTVRLTVAGRRYTQPLMLRLDPRVHTSGAGLALLASLSRETYDDAVAAQADYHDARALVGRLAALSGEAVAKFRRQVDSLAPAPRRRAPGPQPSGPAGPPTLASTRDALIVAMMAMQNADVAPSATEAAACARARQQFALVHARWAQLEANPQSKRPSSADRP